MKILLKILFIGLFIFPCLHAQEIVIDSLYVDSTGSGLFTIEQSVNIKTLVKSSIDSNCKKSAPTKQIVTDKQKYIDDLIKKQPAADRCSITPKLMGYKIQVYYTKNRALAEKIKNEFNSKFPEIGAKVEYLQPDFKVLAGDYLSKNSSSRDFLRIKKQYPNSFLIQFPVRCRTAH